jgi:dihydrofolate synthase/folylpolyglutamate synthase
MESRFNTPEEGFSYIQSFLNVERGLYQPRLFRLERMHALLGRFGNPHRAYKIIHIAGTKGKGSTAAFAASILREAGYKTGLYTSPHVVSYRERITLAGSDPGDMAYLTCLEMIAAEVDRMKEESTPEEELPTTFELLTLLGFLVFRQTECRWAVIETGLGGRLDATNVVEPEASVITPIELEHTEYLGDTIRAIAGEKAGIIKPARPVFSAPQHPDAEKVLRDKAEQLGCPVTFLFEAADTISSTPTPAGTDIRVKWKSGESSAFTIPMIGRIQGENAVLARIAAAGCIPVDEDTFGKAVQKTKLPGRGELISGTPPFLLDGAHTESSVRRVLDSFKALFPDKTTLIFGAVEGKNIESMARILGPAFNSVIITTPGTFKKSDPPGVQQTFLTYNPAARLEADPGKAAAAAADLGNPVLVTGSFYLVSEVRRELEK